MYHVELRKFPNLARVFNMTREELEARFLAAWVAEEVIECEDRDWDPRAARITILEGPRLRPEDIGLGRGWANAARTGAQVTDQLLSEAQRAAGLLNEGARGAVQQLRQRIIASCAEGRLAIHGALLLASELHPRWRVSDRLALAERCVWELLHEGALSFTERQPEPARVRFEPVAKDHWEAALLALGTWTNPASAELYLEAGQKTSPVDREEPTR